MALDGIGLMLDWLDSVVGLGIMASSVLFMGSLVIIKLSELLQEYRQSPQGTVDWVIRMILSILTAIAFYVVPPLMAVAFIKEIFGVAEGWPLFLGFLIGLGIMALLATHPVMKQWSDWLEGKRGKDL